MKIALVYRKSVPWTTGNYIFNAFQHVKSLSLEYSDFEIFHMNPGESKFADIYFWIDSGHEEQVNTPQNKTAFYLIDCGIPSHRDNWMRKIAGRYVTLVGNWEAVHILKDFHVYMLPLGYDHTIFYPYPNSPKKWDVSFVGGRQNDGLRGQILDQVHRDEFTFHCPPGGTVHGHELREVIHASRVVLDIPPIDSTHFVGQRFYEAMGCNANVVTYSRQFPAELGRQHLYTSTIDVCEAIANALHNPQLEWGNTDRFRYINRVSEILLPILLRMVNYESDSKGVSLCRW